MDAADSAKSENPSNSSTDGVSNNSVATTDGAQVSADGEQAQQQQPAARPGGWAMIKTLAIRMIFIYAITSFFRRSPTPPANQNQTGGSGGTMAPSTNIYVKQSIMDMYVYISETEKFTDFTDESALFWHEEDLIYGDWTGGMAGDGSYTKHAQISASSNVQNNGSIFLHIFFVKSGMSPNPADKERYSKFTTVYKSHKLNKHKRRKYHDAVNLITGTSDTHPAMIKTENQTTAEMLSHWHPNLTINLIDDHTPWSPGSVPSTLSEFINFVPETNQYQPILFVNAYWNLNSDYMPINDTTPKLNFTLTYSPMSLFKWQMYAAQGMRNQWTSFLGDSSAAGQGDEEDDMLKQTFLDTNPWLLGLTIVVSLVHSVFEFLAFKNDIQFWRNRKSLEGLSVRTVFFNVFQSLIVLLYVLDNETNFVVRLSVFVGLIIEMWKIHKVVNIKIDRENLIAGLLPRIVIEDKSTYTESMTKQYDKLAFRYLSWLLFPLLVGYAIYSVMYQEHKGWYSWVLNMAYGYLLTFGFIMMTPQLFINYKLKSVAHLPWRMLSYKALNTFIDDLFAFVIKMPTLYRIGCFRDDIIFLVYLYQRYVYRIDPKRVNEFGTSADMFDANGKVIQPADGEVGEGDREGVGEGEEEVVEKSQTEKKDN